MFPTSEAEDLCEFAIKVAKKLAQKFGSSKSFLYLSLDYLFKNKKCNYGELKTAFKAIRCKLD